MWGGNHRLAPVADGTQTARLVTRQQGQVRPTPPWNIRQCWRQARADETYGLGVRHITTIVCAWRAAAYSRKPVRDKRQRSKVACGAATGKDAVLVIGGTGRVGGSTAYWLRTLAAEEGQDLEVIVAGRRKSGYGSFAQRWQSCRGSGSEVPAFETVDYSDRAALREVLCRRPWSLVVHTAGPFQGVEKPVILEECIGSGVPYVDVCDDTELCKVAKGLSSEAERAGVPAVVSAGIWPGVSALMVAEAVERLGAEAETVDMSFFTAGTGGAGPTIVSATFLLLAEPVVVFESGCEKRAKPWDERRLVDFGPGVGEKHVYLLDEPEVYTCQQALRIQNMRSSFGTDPDIWNWLFDAVRRLPADILRNRELMQAVSVFSMPIITTVDKLVGAANAMRIDARSADGRKVCLRVTHRDLEQCVGFGTAAFALEVMQGKVPAGVWHPVEMQASREAIFRRVNRETLLWDI